MSLPGRNISMGKVTIAASGASPSPATAFVMTPTKSARVNVIVGIPCASSLAAARPHAVAQDPQAALPMMTASTPLCLTSAAVSSEPITALPCGKASIGSTSIPGKSASSSFFRSGSMRKACHWSLLTKPTRLPSSALTRDACGCFTSIVPDGSWNSSVTMRWIIREYPSEDIDASSRPPIRLRDGGLRDQDPTLHPGGVRKADRPGRVPAWRGDRAHRWRAHGRRAARRPTLHGDPQDCQGAGGGVRAWMGSADGGAHRARRRVGARARRGGRTRGAGGLCSRPSLACGSHRGSGRVEPRPRSCAQGQSLRPGRPAGLLGAQPRRPGAGGVPRAGPGFRGAVRLALRSQRGARRLRGGHPAGRAGIEHPRLAASALNPMKQAERPGLHRWTRDEYERLIDHGFLDEDDPVELLDGLLLVKEPQHSRHRTSVLLVARAMERAFGEGWFVQTQSPISLDDRSEPEPDVCVVRGSPRDYVDAHPRSPALSIYGPPTWTATGSDGRCRPRAGSRRLPPPGGAALRR